jgi:hypothetical protein
VIKTGARGVWRVERESIPLPASIPEHVPHRHEHARTRVRVREL